MENESTEGGVLSLDLPAALDDWLAERADDLGVDRSELVVQLVGSYRAAADAEDGEELAAAVDGASVDVESTVRAEVDEAVAAATPDEDALARRVETRLEPRLDELDAEFEEKLDDVRRRVVQLKQEIDGKADGEHEHEELRRLDELAAAVETLRERLDESTSESESGDAELASRVDDLGQKLTQLARVVVELRDDAAEEDGPLTEIRRTAAREGYETAVCGACGESVHVGLLPEAECPHCRSPFGGLVEGSGGLFSSSPRLVGPHDRSDGGDDESDGQSTAAEPVSGLVSDDDPDDGGDGPVTADGGTHE